MEYVKEINAVVNRFIWGRGMLAVFLFVGVMFTVRTGFFQFTKVRIWLGKTIGEMFRDRRVRRTEESILSLSFSLFVRRLQRHLEQGISQVWRQR